MRILPSGGCFEATAVGEAVVGLVAAAVGDSVDGAVVGVHTPQVRSQTSDGKKVLQFR